MPEVSVMFELNCNRVKVFEVEEGKTVFSEDTKRHRGKNVVCGEEH